MIMVGVCRRREIGIMRGSGFYFFYLSFLTPSYSSAPSLVGRIASFSFGSGVVLVMVLALLLPLEPQYCLFQRGKSLASVDGINKNIDYVTFNVDPNVSAKTAINCPGGNSVSPQLACERLICLLFILLHSPSSGSTFGCLVVMS
mmetsp:Transcript_45652/g.111182  ORF Transcript_45652/g.111182 Transcript_45652/m.111182 type:complete len:145 (-) Transcript_45652:54-488(-)